MNKNLRPAAAAYEPVQKHKVTPGIPGWLNNHHWFRLWLVARSAPRHYLNQCWNIVNWTLRNKLQWNINWNSYIFIQENAFENVVCKMACILSRPQWVNSLAPGRFQFNFRWEIFKLTLVNGGWGISYEIALRWMPLNLTDDKSTLVQVMAWCRQATSHYLSQCWPRSMSPYGVTRPQWVNQCCVELITGNLKIFWHFLSFLNTGIAKSHPWGSVYLTVLESIQYLLMICQYGNESGHQQLWNRPNHHGML